MFSRKGHFDLVLLQHPSGRSYLSFSLLLRLDDIHITKHFLFQIFPCLNLWACWSFESFPTFPLMCTHFSLSRFQSLAWGQERGPLTDPRVCYGSEVERSVCRSGCHSLRHALPLVCVSNWDHFPLENGYISNFSKIVFVFNCNCQILHMYLHKQPQERETQMVRSVHLLDMGSDFRLCFFFCFFLFVCENFC